MIYFFKRLSFLFLLFIFITCNRSKEKKADTPISDTITLFSDESFQPIVKAEVDAFEGLYNNTKINTEYKSEDEAIMALLNDNTDAIIISRELNKEENEFIAKKNISINSNKIATDALAFIVNSNYPDSIITTNQLKNIFNGQVKNWNQLSSHLPIEVIEIVVDKNTSSNLSYLKDKMNLNATALKLYAAGSNEKVLDYVRTNPNSIGIIGTNWISDDDDPQLESKLKQIKVLAVSEGNQTDLKKSYQPIQANLAEGLYPLTRSLFIVNKNTKIGLGTGFASFILSDQGQRVILKSGLLPAVMPGREIHINKNNF